MEYRQFPSYNALDRQVLILGVPVLPMMGLGVASIIIYFIGQALFGLVGLLFIFVLFPIFLFLRKISESDDRAMNILFMELLFFFRRSHYKEFGNTLTFLPNQYLRNERVIIQTFEVDRCNTK